MHNPLLKIDEKNGALYFQLDESAIVDSEEIKQGVILDYDANDNIGWKIGGMSQSLPRYASSKDLTPTIYITYLSSTYPVSCEYQKATSKLYHRSHQHLVSTCLGHLQILAHLLLLGPNHL